MKIKLDENLPSPLASRLAAMSHDVQTVMEEGIAGKPDPVVWQAAQREARFLITQDMDFSNAQRFAPGTHHGILLIRLRNPSWRALASRTGGRLVCRRGCRRLGEVHCRGNGKQSSGATTREAALKEK